MDVVECIFALLALLYEVFLVLDGTNEMSETTTPDRPTIAMAHPMPEAVASDLLAIGRAVCEAQADLQFALMTSRRLRGRIGHETYRELRRTICAAMDRVNDTQAPLAGLIAEAQSVLAPSEAPF